MKNYQRMIYLFWENSLNLHLIHWSGCCKPIKQVNLFMILTNNTARDVWMCYSNTQAHNYPVVRIRVLCLKRKMINFLFHTFSPSPAKWKIFSRGNMKFSKNDWTFLQTNIFFIWMFDENQLSRCLLKEKQLIFVACWSKTTLYY